MTLVILPHQLFSISCILDAGVSKTEKVVLWEHPFYFTRLEFNMKKLILHRASMKAYRDLLVKSGFTNVVYKNFKQAFKEKTYMMFDPIDKIQLPGTASFIESPNFLLKKKDYEKYRHKTKKFHFNGFYTFGKKIVDIIPDVKSQDKHNRKRLPDDMVVPSLPELTKADTKYITSATAYIKKHFSKNPGNVDNFIFPVTHSSALAWFCDFVEKRFSKFGDFQDFIDKDNEHLFHSVLSAAMNIGLVNPLDVIDQLRKKSIYGKIPLPAYEGYIRQLFWREYQRYCYIYFDFQGKKYFKGNKRLTRQWYDGTTGIAPVDNAIKTGFDTGYLNHINRLMVIGNFMVLSKISAAEGHKWFMEFSCDSYEWVMAQNVLDMVFHVSGGAAGGGRRPYISSSNYVLKMSNFKRGPWCDKWDALYHEFIQMNKNKLRKYRYYYRV